MPSEIDEWNAVLDENLSPEEEVFVRAWHIRPCSPNAPAVLNAFRDGYAQGHADGYDDGHSDGESEGYDRAQYDAELAEK